MFDKRILPTMNTRHDKILFWGCFIALITTSYAFISRMILCGGQFAADFGLEKVAVGELQGAGIWLDEKQDNRNKAVAIAAGKSFFNQDPKILQFVMENPTDRVTYGDLRMIRAEFEELMELSIQAGTIKHPIAYEKYMDESFTKASKAATISL